MASTTVTVHYDGLGWHITDGDTFCSTLDDDNPSSVKGMEVTVAVCYGEDAIIANWPRDIPGLIC